MQAGCALTNVTVESPRQMNIGTDARRGMGRAIVLVTPFRDRRPDTQRCGMKKNGYNMDMANVNCDHGPGAELAQHLATELAAAGFRVFSSQQQAGPTAMILWGDLEQVFVECDNRVFYGAIETDIALNLKVKFPNGTWYERRLYVKGEEDTFLALGGDFQRSYESGVRNILTTAVGAVLNLADHLPMAPSAVATPVAP